MAIVRISELPAKGSDLTADDLICIAYVDGTSSTGYRTAYLTGQQIIDGIGANNIYTSDGQLSGDRTVDGNDNFLKLLKLEYFQVQSNAVPSPSGTPFVDFFIDPSGAPTSSIFQIRDALAKILEVKNNGTIEFNEAYSFPTADGTAGQVLTTDGAGNLTFATSASSTNIYNANGTLTGNRVLDGDGSQYYLVFNNLSFHGAVINPPLGLTDDAILYQIDPTNIGTGTGGMLTIEDSVAGVQRFKAVKDGSVIINEEYTLPNTGGIEGSFLVTTAFASPGANTVEFKKVYNIASSQWNTTAPTTTLGAGDIANGFTFFDETTDKSSSGTTSYDEYVLWFGISITLSGTSGTADIVVGGVTYPITFNTDLFTTAEDWVNTNQTALNAGGYQVFALGSGTDGRIRFGAITDTGLNAITITNTSGTLAGTIANEFTGSGTASYDHVVIPYEGQPYENQRLQHYMRVNFNIDTGNETYARLQLRRWQNDSVIGSDIPVRRYSNTQGITGQQHVFETYTNSPTDAFVTGGFYFALENGAASIDVSGSAGILIQTNYEQPLFF